MTQEVKKVFDPRLWAGKDVGNNSQFFKPADILSRYKSHIDGKELADVRFHHDGRTSRGHFTQYMEDL